MIINRDLAHYAVKNAINRGKLKCPSMCDVCHKVNIKIVSHHWKGYAEDSWLDIIWVCQSCHSLHHAAEKFPEDNYCLIKRKIKKSIKKKCVMCRNNKSEVTYNKQDFCINCYQLLKDKLGGLMK